ncbi:MAG: hypothetical protein GY750_14705, partial [Lentisphaerae bacterium]|nr:hypothetical protein [Lentisphaerota bacterium]
MKRFMKSTAFFCYFIVLCLTAQTALAAALNNGVPVPDISASRGSWLHYQIDVPSGSSNLIMTVSGGSGDADLYTRFGSQPTGSAYDCRSSGNDNNEECTVASPQAGTYYISLYAFSTFSGVSLVASYSNGSSSGD